MPGSNLRIAVVASLILVFGQVHRKYNALVLTAFNNDSGFVASLDKVAFLLLIKVIAFRQIHR